MNGLYDEIMQSMENPMEERLKELLVLAGIDVYNLTVSDVIKKKEELNIEIVERKLANYQEIVVSRYTLFINGVAKAHFDVRTEYDFNNFKGTITYGKVEAK